MVASPEPENAPAAPTRVAPGRRAVRWAAGFVVAGLAAGALLWVSGLPNVWLNAGAARRAVDQERYTDAIGLLDRWLAARPGSAEAHFLRARALLGLDRAEDALHDLEQARAHGYPEPPLERLVGIVLALGGRHEAAEPLLLKSRPAGEALDAEVEEGLTRIYFATDRLKLASISARRWADAAPDDPAPWRWRAEIDARLRLLPYELAEDYGEILRRDPNDRLARFNLGESLRNAGRLDEATRAFDAYLHDYPDDPDALTGSGRTAVLLGDDDQAARLLDRALELDPRQPEALQARAAMHMRQREWAKALPLLDRTIEVRPDNPEPHFERAVALNRLGRERDAEESLRLANQIRRDVEILIDFRRKLSRNPEDITLVAEAAEWMLRSGYDDEGLLWAQRALDSPGGHPPTARALADYYDRKGDAARANYYRLLAGPNP